MKLVALAAAALFLLGGFSTAPTSYRHPPYLMQHTNDTDNSDLLVYLCPAGVVTTTGCDPNMAHGGYVVKACASVVDEPASLGYGPVLFYAATFHTFSTTLVGSVTESCETYYPHERTFTAGTALYVRLGRLSTNSTGGASAQVWVVNTDR